MRYTSPVLPAWDRTGMLFFRERGRRGLEPRADRWGRCSQGPGGAGISPETGPEGACEEP